MKPICKTLLISMLVVTSACQAQPVKKEIENDLLREKLKGNLKTMTATDYRFYTDYDGKVEKEWKQKVRTSYNRQGNIVEQCQYEEDGSLSEKLTVECDSLGKAIKQLYFNWNGDLLGTVSNHYDENGNLAEIVKYDDKGNITDKKIYTYDNKGNRTEEKHLMLLNGSVRAEFVERGEYKDGLLHKKEVYQDGKKIAEHRLTYNAAGENNEQISYDGDGKFRWRLVSQYNEQGDTYQWIQYSESGKITVEGGGRYEYDSQGNAIKIQSYQNSELIFEEIREMEYY